MQVSKYRVNGENGDTVTQRKKPDKNKHFVSTNDNKET